MKLLIVDDNAKMRQLIRLVVTDLVAVIYECSDGDEVLRLYTAQQFRNEDRVVMDLQMQRVGGLEATRRLRAAYPDAHVIIVTNHDDVHWCKAARQVGASGFVSKGNLLKLRVILTACPFAC